MPSRSRSARGATRWAISKARKVQPEGGRARWIRFSQGCVMASRIQLKQRLRAVRLPPQTFHPLAPTEADAQHYDGYGECHGQAHPEFARGVLDGHEDVAHPRRVGRDEV